MVKWFGPVELLRAGMRALFATLMSTYPDRRETLAALSPLSGRRPHDFGHAQELWIDFVADTGDGWDSTYSVGLCLNRQALSNAGPRGAGGERRAVVVVPT